MRKAYSEARLRRVQLGVQKNLIRRPSLADAADCLRFANPAEAARKPGTLEQRGVKWQWNGMEPHTME